MIDARSLTLSASDPQALAAMNEQYFGIGLRYVASVRALALQPGGADISTAQFAQHYVPTMRAITGFRDSVIGLAQGELRENRQSALLTLAGAGLAETALLAVLIWMVAGFMRHVIGPFVQATGIIDAIARDDLATEIPEVSASRFLRILMRMASTSLRL
ncbi:hypothetical protein [Paraburkholderia phenazinium]|uniref:Uncharacterized protein n=1 Tax=Paraburkholderia phenazinium TaxID=60549 RepID=A0A1G8K740_9BURK|nr:hypothetical protein [Paraburkholderia phenazinium]SDI39258.1 hypothetical protein SAMN05216466_12210 [Paraburkholderia phenazinium]